jgi:hypothetical protein
VVSLALKVGRVDWIAHVGRCSNLTSDGCEGEDQVTKGRCKHGCQNAAIYDRRAEDLAPPTRLTLCGGKAGTVLCCLAKFNQPLVWTCTAIGRKIRPAFDSCHLDPTPLSFAYDAEPGLYAFL